MLRQQRLQGEPSLSQPQNQLNQRFLAPPVSKDIQPVSQNNAPTEDINTNLPISKSAHNLDNDPKKPSNVAVLRGGASALRPSSPMTMPQQPFDSTPKTHSPTTSISSTAEMMQGRPVSTISMTGAARSYFPPAMKHVDSAHSQPSTIRSLAWGADFRPSNTAQSANAHKPLIGAQTQAGEVPQGKIKSGNVRKDNLESIHEAFTNQINAGIGSQFSKIPLRESEEGQLHSIHEAHYDEKDAEANNGQRMVTDTNSNAMEMNHKSTGNTDKVDGQETNEIKDHEGKRDDDPYWSPLSLGDPSIAAGTRKLPVQEVITGQAGPYIKCTTEDSEELDPRLSGMPTVPEDKLTIVNGAKEVNLDVDNGKEKATLLSN